MSEQVNRVEKKLDALIGLQLEHADPYSLYKPRKNGQGGAMQFKPAYRKVKETGRILRAIFVEAANQNGQQSFDWGEDKKIRFKMGEVDIGKIMAVLEGRASSVELMHQNPDGNSWMELKKQDEAKYGYYLSMRRKPTTGDLRRVSIAVTIDEASNLLALLRAFLPYMKGWVK